MHFKCALLTFQQPGELAIDTCPFPSPYITWPVADPGFPRGGGANFLGGRQHMILPNFPKNCMKLKEFGPPGGTSVPCDPLDPPLLAISAKVKPF